LRTSKEMRIFASTGRPTNVNQAKSLSHNEASLFSYYNTLYQGHTTPILTEAYCRFGVNMYPDHSRSIDRSALGL